ncbi:MAG TPA: hypothetical protein H9692_06075 [Firmicutes bacterium]|nr:hypothetical protein [Bacillota bacterium]
MMNVIAERMFGVPYIVLDSVFILAFLALLLTTRRRLAALWAIAGGVLYFIVDYGIFHLLTGSRHIGTVNADGVFSVGGEGMMFGVLMWMSLSYGITNFAWIWLCLKKDKRIAEWTVLIFVWWLVCPILDNAITGDGMHVRIWRETVGYHWFMAVFLAVSYFAVIVYNLFQKDGAKRMRILWLFGIGVAVQFGWEFALLLGGIRSGSMEFAEQLRVLAVNSLMETNLGLPAMYCIYLFVTSRVREDLTVRDRISFSDRLAENNAERYRPCPTAPETDDE